MASIESQVRFWTKDPGTILLAQLCDQLKTRVDACCGTSGTNVAASRAATPGSPEASRPASAPVQSPASGTGVEQGLTASRSEGTNNTSHSGTGKRKKP
jgi:hypothetical protein